MRDHGVNQLQHTLPKGIWLNFDFDDSHPDLPVLYLQGGSIIPFGHPYQHVGEADPSDDLSVLVALDEHGKAKGVLYEDDGDGYEYTKGGYLLTTYVAELQSSIVTVSISKTEGSWKRPKRRLHAHLLLGKGAMLDAWGEDGEVLQIIMPSESEVSNLESASEKKYKSRMETVKPIPDAEKNFSGKGLELSRTPVEMKSGDWAVKVVPWIGGRILSMEHIPSENLSVEKNTYKGVGTGKERATAATTSDVERSEIVEKARSAHILNLVDKFYIKCGGRHRSKIMVEARDSILRNNFLLSSFLIWDDSIFLQELQFIGEFHGLMCV